MAIGASAGAIQALSRILPELPEQYRIPILIVVHVPADGSDLPQLFRTKCRLAVKEAEDKEPILPGTIYFAPPDYHLLVEPDRTISLSLDAPVLYSRPSIDVLFESAADAYGADLTGIILTGANEDGADGLVAVAQAGGVALVEDPAEAFAKAMPSGALARCPQATRLSLDAITARLLAIEAS
ncbi:chemotaxis protein CheB [Sphingomonas sp. BIUV-7]|uniref:protein-glutamate methylesterase n=1 Tax=Sphingomonas natans TaxID=3063330 RepID=A0ABT8Y5F9_9SPHN|nr:chemotaxis protein CheB [Sphingomonas sp. BIUV-7]MDO6413560.1 chemotaxis protein CheB [Sphingomonas sp. BIUV-7]